MKNKEDHVKDENVSRDRKRFVAALGLFLAWIAVLVGLAVKSGYRPMDRAGAVPASMTTDGAQGAPE
jgi:hypothetical protein